MKNISNKYIKKKYEQPNQKLTQVKIYPYKRGKLLIKRTIFKELGKNNRINGGMMRRGDCLPNT